MILTGLSTYLIGILYLFTTQFIGNLYSKYGLKSNNSILLNFIYGYFIISSICAIVTTGGITIAWGVIILLICMISFKNEFVTDNAYLHPFTEDKKDYYVAFILFTICFISRFSIHYNYENGLVNIPFRDYLFYINHGEYFYLTGIENKLTSKNILFEGLTFLEPYRNQDSWPMSIFLHFTRFSSIDIYYLILYPFNFFLVSFAMYSLLKKYTKELTLTAVILVSFFFIFFQTDNFWSIYLGKLTIGLASYTKLWLHFTILSCYLLLQINGQDLRANYMLLMLFFTVPVTLSIPLFIILSILISVLFKNPISKSTLLFLGLIFSYALFVIVNQKLQQNALNIFKLDTFSSNFRSFINASLYINLLVSNLITPSILILSHKLLNIELPFSSKYIGKQLMLLFSGYVCYVILHQTNDSTQLYGNISVPIGSIISFILLFNLISEIRLKLYRYCVLLSALIILSHETINAHITSRNYARHNISNVFNVDFIKKASTIVQEKVTNPVGIYYPESKYGVVSEQHLRDEEFDMTLLMGRYYDVVNIKGDSILFDDTRYKKIDRDWHRMAINIYAKRNPGKTNIELSFIQDCNIQFMLSKLRPNQLPQWLQNLITETVTDPKSGLNLYLLNPNLAKDIPDTESIRN